MGGHVSLCRYSVRVPISFLSRFYEKWFPKTLMNSQNTNTCIHKYLFTRSWLVLTNQLRSWLVLTLGLVLTVNDLVSLLTVICLRSQMTITLTM